MAIEHLPKVSSILFLHWINVICCGFWSVLAFWACVTMLWMSDERLQVAVQQVVQRGQAMPTNP